MYTKVTAYTSGNTIDFRLAHKDAAEFKDALTRLVLDRHAPVSEAPSDAGIDVPTRLRALAQLHTEGILSDEEFAAAKAKLLA